MFKRTLICTACMLASASLMAESITADNAGSAKTQTSISAQTAANSDSVSASSETSAAATTQNSTGVNVGESALKQHQATTTRGNLGGSVEVRPNSAVHQGEEKAELAIEKAAEYKSRAKANVNAAVATGERAVTYGEGKTRALASQVKQDADNRTGKIKSSTEAAVEGGLNTEIEGGHQFDPSGESSAQIDGNLVTNVAAEVTHDVESSVDEQLTAGVVDESAATAEEVVEEISGSISADVAEATVSEITAEVEGDIAEEVGSTIDESVSSDINSSLHQSLDHTLTGDLGL